MKHVLLNKDGQVHATILACPFKYTVPRGMTVYEDNPTMGQLPVDCFHYSQPKCHEESQDHAMDFAIIKDGVVQNVIVWGGAEWCPPFGVTMVPVAQYMGVGDYYDHCNDAWQIHPDRLGKKDDDKTVKELQADADAAQLS